MIENTTDWTGRYQATCADGAVGLLHEYATHHVRVDTSLGRIYGRDDWAAALAAERAGMSGDGVLLADGWTGEAGSADGVVLELDWRVSHTGPSPLFGPPTGGRTTLSSAMVGLAEGGRLFRAWRFVDHGAAALALRLDLDGCAKQLAAAAPARGGVPWEFGEVRAGLGQLAPADAMPAPPGLAPECAAPCLRLQSAWNARRFDQVTPLYAAGAVIRRGAETMAPGSLGHPWARIVAACPDAVLFLEQAVTRLEAGVAVGVAIVWRWVGTHTGAGFGAPSRGRLHARGLSVFHLSDGRIAGERVIFDELGFRRDVHLRSRGGTPQ